MTKKDTGKLFKLLSYNSLRVAKQRGRGSWESSGFYYKKCNKPGEKRFELSMQSLKPCVLPIKLHSYSYRRGFLEF
jgi:hypothetical protein